MENKQIIIILIFISIVNFSFFSQENWDIIGKIKSNGKLKALTFNTNNYPFTYKNDSNIVGYDIEIIKNISKNLGVKLEIVNNSYSTAGLIIRLNNDEGDIGISKIKSSIDDALFLTYSKPYLNVGYVLLINRLKFSEYKKDIDPVEILRDENLPVGTLDNNLYNKYVNKIFPNGKLKLYDSINSLTIDLLKGNITAAFMDEIEGKLVLKEKPEYGINLQYYTLKGISDNLYIVSSWRNKTLIAWINIFLDSKYEKVLIDEIITRNFQ